MFVSALVLRGIADPLRSLGLTPEELTRGTGIDTAVMMDASARVPLDAVDRYVHRAMTLSGDAGLGLTLADREPAGALVMLHHLLLACSSLREAITAFQRLAGRLVEHVQWELIEEGDRARFVYKSSIWLGDVSRFAADFALTFSHRLAGNFATPALKLPHSVSFRHARPAYADRYWDVFRCPIQFDAPHNEIVFAREVLDLDRYLGNQVLKQSMESSATRILASVPEAERISERVRLILRYASDLEDTSAEGIARRMALSERTLRRKLRNEGVSLMELVDNVRKEIACEELTRPEVCIQRTADRLGFADRTAFHRAFKRWTGETPLGFRERSVNQDAEAQG